MRTCMKENWLRFNPDKIDTILGRWRQQRSVLQWCLHQLLQLGLRYIHLVGMYHLSTSVLQSWDVIKTCVDTAMLASSGTRAVKLWQHGSQHGRTAQVITQGSRWACKARAEAHSAAASLHTRAS